MRRCAWFVIVVAAIVSCVEVPDIETRVLGGSGGGGAAFSGGAGALGGAGNVGNNSFGGVGFPMPMPVPIGGMASAGMPGTGGMGTGGMPPPLGYCDGMTPEPLPMVMTDRFAASGYYETSWQELTPAAAPCADRPDGAQGQCMGFTWAPVTRTWVGLLYQYPPNNWDGPGLCIQEGATQISFFARGEEGGEVVEFSAVNVVVPVVLEKFWTQFTIDLEGIDYNDFSFESGGVRGAFSIVLTRLDDDLLSKTIYIDDVQWLQDGVEVGGAGGAPASAGNGGAPPSGGMGGAVDSAGGAGAGGVGGLP